MQLVSGQEEQYQNAMREFTDHREAVSAEDQECLEQWLKKRKEKVEKEVGKEVEMPSPPGQEEGLPADMQMIVLSAQVALLKNDYTDQVKAYFCSLSYAVSQEWIQGCM